jgi:hypothetical protein
MRTPQLKLNRPSRSKTPDRAVRPNLEGLEDRVLLYSDLGDQWTYSSRITFSIMPDGTNIGGVPSTMFQTLNAKFSTPAWVEQILVAASLWEGATNANLALVPDSGAPVATPGNQQDDPRFGDIRIGMIPLSPGVLAETFLPPPGNGGTTAGDILLSSSVNWQLYSSYDLQTVVAHEFGHALGLGESYVSTAVMYGYYNGIKQALTSDDIAGIQSIYGTRQFDRFNNGGQRDSSYHTPTNITAYIGSNLQIAIPGLDITTMGDSEWFYVIAPSTTSGTMSVSVQSSNLSLLSPEFQIYNSSLTLLSQQGTPGILGTTISSSTSVQPGKGYYIKVFASGSTGPIGGYGLLVNFGNLSQSPIPPPNTVVLNRPNQLPGIANNVQITGVDGVTTSVPISGPQQGAYAAIGSLSGWVEIMSISSSTGANQTSGTNLSGGTSSSISSAATFTTQTTMSATIAVSIPPPPPTQSSLTPVILGVSPTVLQAVDSALDQLLSDD